MRDAGCEGLRKGGREKDALLIAHGVRDDGSRVLLGVYMGGRETTDSWKGALQELKWRGVQMDDDVRQAAVLAFKRASEKPITIAWADKIAA